MGTEENNEMKIHGQERNRSFLFLQTKEEKRRPEQKAPSSHLRFWWRVRNNTDQLKWVCVCFLSLNTHITHTYRLKKWTCIKLLLFKYHHAFFSCSPSLLPLRHCWFYGVLFMFVLFRNRLFVAFLFAFSLLFLVCICNWLECTAQHAYACKSIEIKRRRRRQRQWHEKEANRSSKLYSYPAAVTAAPIHGSNYHHTLSLLLLSEVICSHPISIAMHSIVRMCEMRKWNAFVEWLIEKQLHRKSTSIM